MTKKIVVQKDEKGRTFIDLPADVMKLLKLKVGDWVELLIDEKKTYVRKVDMCMLKTSLPQAIVDGIHQFQKKEGYYSEEEAITNLLVRGLILHLQESKLEEDLKLAAKLKNKWYLKIYEITACNGCGKMLAEKDVKINTSKYGLLCADCWAKKMGEFVEKHPISD
jgi:bifunctional DNA-binding transcriptional regulator/antitoxin component of YhaV-PrlF toxin-antitoxin module